MEHLHFNKLCHIEDWNNPWLRLALRAVQEKKRIGWIIHRKYWEWAMGILASALSGLLTPQSIVLGVGAGHEIPIFFFTKFSKWVWATDIYGKGNFSRYEADQIMMLLPQLYSPFPFPKERLIVEFMDMLHLRLPDNSMDIVFCFSSIEHLPSLKDKKRAFAEMLRVLKPGSLLIITTEYIIKGAEKVPSSEVEAFSREEIEQLFLSQEDSIPIDTVEYSISERTLKTLQPFTPGGGLPDPALPHIVLKTHNTIFTSLFLGFWKKPIKTMPRFPSLKEAERLPYFADPHFYRQPQGIVYAPKQLKAIRGEMLNIELRLENLGKTPWYFSPFSPVPLFILDSHIFSPGGEEVQKHLCCLPIEREVAAGKSLKLLYQTIINLKPGKYILRFNLANCKDEWFGKEGIASWAGESLLEVK